MKSYIRPLAAGLTAGALLVGFAGPSHAALSMCVYTGTSAVGCPGGSTIITDNLPGDEDGTLGAVEFSTPFATFSSNSQSGGSFPATTMDLSQPIMTLQADNVVGAGGGGTYTVELSADGWGPTSATLAFIGFLSSANFQTELVNWRVYWDPTDTLFARTTQVGNQLSVTGFQSDQFNDNLGAFGASPYSITIVAEFTQTSSTGAFTSSLTAVPEPASLALLGIGCLGVYGVGIRRRRKAA